MHAATLFLAFRMPRWPDVALFFCVRAICVPMCRTV
jgi:hypothetical protein